ncbi:MAG TPA: efflux RND transporter periplasmic adaptor subunit [Vicinamibacterales bacterium]|nr:efflux RND transporter periplasmic adaptor subunit [Vicinamibacterales bacterium]
MNRNWKSVCVAVTLAAGLSTAACGGGRSTEAAAGPAPLPAVPVVRASQGTIEDAIEISGNLVPQTRVDVHAKVGGTLDRVLVRLGDTVGEGAVLATLDRREIDAQVDAASAAVEVARAALAAADAGLVNAAQEVERARNLFEKGALPRQRLDGADAAWRGAQAQRDLAKANIAQAEATLRRAREVQRDATLRAPVAGVIVERNFDAGNLVGPGGEKPVVAVADLRALKLEAGVSELDAGRLKVGAVARITLPAKPGRIYEGRLVALAPEVDPRNRHFQVEIRVENRGQELLSGMYASARIVVNRAEGLVLPREAVLSRNGGRAVYRVSGDQVSIVPVAEGPSDGRRTLITSGVRAGDLIVSDARRDVAEGARVRPVANQ